MICNEPETDLVGSRTGATLRRFSLAVAPRLLWECLSSQTVSWFPAPASSNPSCRFPAMGLPVCFPSRVMRPLRLTWLSGVTMVDEAGNLCEDPASRTACSAASLSGLLAINRVAVKKLARGDRAEKSLRQHAL